MKKLRIKLIILGALVCSTMLIFFMYINSLSNPQEEVRKITIAFYEDYFYERVSTGKTEETLQDVLKAYGDNGLRVNLEAMLQALEISETSDLYGKIKKCDFKKTKATIFPESPYTKRNYKFTLDVVCD